MIRNLLYSISSNFMNFAVSVVLALIIPRFLGTQDYAYYQLYTFYVSYKGLLHLGWLDGLYLKYGGEKYENINKSSFHEQLVLLAIMESVLILLVVTIAVVTLSDIDKRIVFIAFGLASFVYLISTFFRYVLQATNRIEQYAKSVFAERIVYAVIVVVFIVSGHKNYKWLLLADILSAIVTLCILAFSCKEVTFAKSTDYIRGVREAIDNIRVGSKLLIGGISGMLIVGIVRQMIETRWGIDVFGKVSLSLSISNMLLVFISAVSLVLYPFIRTIDSDKIKELYKVLSIMLRVCAYAMLLMYFPLKILLSLWLPKYKESLDYMALLFPMCLYESMYNLIILTFLKALRKEKAVMIINWFIVGIEAVILLLCHTQLPLTVFTITMMLGLRCYIGAAYVNKEFQIGAVSGMAYECIMVGLFVCAAYYKMLFLIVIYSLMYIWYLITNYSSIINAYRGWKSK